MPTPDPQTLERIAHLAEVGHALDEISNETNHQTQFFLGREALNKFAAGIDQLELSERHRQGVDRAIKFLRQGLEASHKQFNQEASLD